MTRLSRLLSLLFVCSLGPLVLAQSADLSVMMTAPSTTVYTTSYAEANAQFTVTNAGPSTAQGVVVDFDSSVRYVNCPTGFTSSQAGGHYRCTAASMAPGSLSGAFSAEWDQAPNGTIETLTATVASSSADPNTANNSASAETTVVWQSDLHINPFVPSTAAPGAYVDIIEFYANHGPSPASDFKLTISVPPGALYDHYSADPSSALKCTEPPKGGSGDLVCTNPNLNVVSDFTVTATVRIDPAAVSGTVLTFPAKATSSTAAAPFQTSSSLTVLSPADLGVAVSAPASVVAGNSFLTTITLTNAGPTAALDVSVDYVQPNGPNTYGTMSAPPGWVCTRSVCTNHSFAPGTATFTIPVPIESFTKSGTMTGEVIVESANDPNSANNTASAATTIIAAPQATVQLSMTAAPDVVHTGDQLTYTARIRNTSSVDAQNVNLHWELPATLVATTCGSVSSPGCTFPTIAAGATQTATWTVQVAAGAGTVLTGRTTINGTNLPSVPPATVSTTVAAPPPARRRAARH